MYAVVYETYYEVEGDERPRTHPGHGYPAHAVRYDKMEQFSTEGGLLAWLKHNNSSYAPKKVKVYKLTELAVTTEVKIELKEQA